MVERSQWRGNPDHPYRTNPLLKVTSVPTVLLIRDDEAIVRAEKDEDFENIELLSMMAHNE